MEIYSSGTIINNRYEVVQGPIEKTSLAGGMGLVYLCVDHAEDGKPVALKTFRPELLSNRAARDRFLREGTTWVELGKHPHIVHCYQVFKADVGPEVFFALELVAAAEGKKDASLRSWLIPNKPLPLEQALLFALHICRGMVHATHKIPGMVHRDLKPENILIGRDGRARVTDFGLASAAQNLDSDWQMDGDTSSSHIRTQLTHGIAGTPLYMAPEQWAGEPLDERADIYAFGCILYEMICGRFAVNGKSVEELQEAHCLGRLKDIPTDLKETLSSLLQRCLTLNQADRFSNWIELEKDVAEVYYIISKEKAPKVEVEVKNTRAGRINVGWSYNAMGVSYYEIDKYSVACNYFKVAISIARKEGDRALEGVALGNMGNAYADLGDHHQAIACFEQNIIIAREIGNRHGESIALGNLGSIYLQSGDLHKAIVFYKQFLAITHEFGDRYGEASALGNLGIAYFQSGDIHEAITFYKKHLAIACEIGDRHGEGNALNNLGSAYGKLGDFHQAVKYFEQRLKIAREIGDRHGESSALGNLGIVNNYLGDTHQAIKFYEQSLAIDREIGDIISIAQTSYNLAIILRKERAFDALKCAEYALNVFSQIGQQQIVVQVQELINEIKSSL